MGPLHGVKIVEMAGIGPTPMCAMLLSDMGAEVIRVDRLEASGLGLGGDPQYELLNRGPRSVAIALTGASTQSGRRLRWRSTVPGIWDGVRVLEAGRSGEGEVVDAAMTGGCASFMTMFYGMLAREHGPTNVGPMPWTVAAISTPCTRLGTGATLLSGPSKQSSTLSYCA
jgi:crotonobetainyl-CoA:carnitine CoA-transferase CaiB-like acyl-CoA transferase